MEKVHGYIEEIEWFIDSGRIYLDGYAFIEGASINLDHKVKKSFIIKHKDKKYYVPAKNVFRNDITDEFGNGEFNYDYAGFTGFIDLEFIDNMGPLSEGTWDISIYINAEGMELEKKLTYIGNPITNKRKFVALNSYRRAKSIQLKLKGNELKVESTNKKVSLGEYINLVRSQSNTIMRFKKFILKQKRKIGNKSLQMVYFFTKKCKIRKNRVTFLSDSRVDFTGNFEFIYDELNKRGGYEIKHILNPSITAPRSLKDMYSLVYYISTSRYVLLDDYYPQIYKFKIREGVDVIQLWHATGAFKTFGFSRLGKKGGPRARSKNHRNYTKAIVSSESIRSHYAEAFGISETSVIPTGVPRTDIFFDDNYKEKTMNLLYEKYPMLKDKKVIMFAPTFRGNGQKSAYYEFDKFEIEKLREKFGDEYKVIVKLHPFIKTPFIIPDSCKEFVIDLSEEREINDLLFITDILITDYSSVCFEYSLLNKPMIFFAYDLDEYIASRDFYYPYESFVPGPIVKNTDAMIKVIEEENFELEKLDKFRNTFFDQFDGKSTERVVDQLLKVEE